MNPEDLQNFEPAWKNIPAPPTRLPGTPDPGHRPAVATIEEFITSAPNPLTLPEESPASGSSTTVTLETAAFYYLYTEDGHTYLQCGSVFGGNGGTVTIPDEKVLDATTGVGTNSGKILYLRANCEATVEDGIMLPGCKLLTANTGLLVGTSVPANHTFTTSADTGYLYIEIGRWTDSEFLPSAPGNILARGCIGNFHLYRA
jgi:hypothetical protein